MQQKFYFVCKKCKNIIAGFEMWFEHGQKCPKCGSNWVETIYNQDKDLLKSLIYDKSNVKNLWHYFDFLPLNDKSNIVTTDEGTAPVQQWEFLEKFAKDRYNVNCKIYVFRNDVNTGTGTFKDIAGTLAASVLKEHGIKEYVVASTGNTANAFAHYLAAAGIMLYVFMPHDALKANEAEVNSYGQKCFKVQGDYHFAKKVAAEFAKKHNILISGGNIDPLRVESKKTWVFEWLRQMSDFPTVYFQALSGGTGPIAIEKAIEELQKYGIDRKVPRFISVQPDKCAPMAHAWQKAKQNNFPNGWQHDYPIYENPITSVPTLATGNPGNYPIIADLTRKTDGDIIIFEEDKLIDLARLIAFETTVRIGPASAVTIGGFFEALKKGLIYENDVVMLNIGEGVRRAPDFMEQMIYTTENVSNIEQCRRVDRNDVKKQLWDKII